MKKLKRRIGVALAMLTTVCWSFAPQVKADFQVNTFTTNSQNWPAIAVAPDGSFITTWESFGQDGSGYGIYARRYAVNGAPIGGEFQVNTTTTNDQRVPDVAVDDSGNFIIAWQSIHSGNNDIYAQRYNSAGTPIGGEFLVNQTTANDQSEADVAIDSDGDFIITWSSLAQDGSGFGIYARRFASNGTPLSNEFLVNTFTTNDQSFSSVAVSDDGSRFVIIWESDGQDGGGRGVYGQVYDINGNTVGGEFRINETTTGNQFQSAVAADADGNFVATWTSQGQDGAGDGVYARSYDSNGNDQTNEFLVNDTTAGDQNLPDIGMNDDGEYIITWQSFGQDGDGYGIFAKQYDAFDNEISNGEFQVNTYVTDDQTNAAAGIADNGNFRIVWDSFGQDGDDFGIFGQRFLANGNFVDINQDPVADGGPDRNVTQVDLLTPVVLDGSASFDPDGDDQLTYQFFENGQPITTNSDDPTRTVFLTPGTHVITLVVTDSEGGTDSDTFVINVVPPASTPNAGGSGTGTLNGTNKKATTTFNAYNNKKGPGGAVVYTDKRTNFKLESTQITAVLVSGNVIRIYGIGKVNGVPGFDFIVTANNNFPSFVNRGDGFALVVSNGYSIASYFDPGDVFVAG